MTLNAPPLQGTHAERPANPYLLGYGPTYWETDTQTLWYWDSTASAWFQVGGAGGGSGASTTDHFLVGMAGQGDADLTNKVVIPGLSGSVDVRVAGTNDDEFDQNALVVPSGWTVIPSGTPDTVNTTDALSHLHIVCSAAAGTNWKGIYKAAPSMPFTMTAKLADASPTANYNAAALAIGEAGATGKLDALECAHNGSDYVMVGEQFANRTTWTASFYAPAVAIQARPPIYFRIVAHSSANVDYLWSYGGRAFTTITTGRNPGFTIGAVLLMVKSENATYPMEAYFDWIRFS